MDVSPLAPRADFSGVRTMLQRRAERHSAALDVYAARRTAGVDMLERWVAQQAAKATGDLAASLGAISTDMAVLERSRVMHLDEAALTGVRCATRQACCPICRIVRRLLASLAFIKRQQQYYIIRICLQESNHPCACLVSNISP